MRKLMWLAIGFATACALVAYLPIMDACLFLGIICVIVGAGLCFVKSRTALIAALLLLGIGTSALWNFGYYKLYLQFAQAVDGETRTVAVEVSDYSSETEYGRMADGAVRLEGRRFRVRMYLDAGEPLKPGDRVSGSFRFRLTTAGGEEAATYHQGKGIFLLAYGEKNTKAEYTDELPFRYYPAMLRKNILETLNRIFPEDTSGFANARCKQ